MFSGGGGGGLRNRVERRRGGAAERGAHQCDGAEDVGPNQRGPGRDRRAEIMSDHRGHRAVAERIDQSDRITRQVGRTPRREIRIVIGDPARGAAISAQIGSDDIVAGIGKRRHDVAPGVGDFGEAVQQQQTGTAMYAGFQHVHGQSVHPRHEAGAQSFGQKRGVKRRQRRGHAEASPKCGWAAWDWRRCGQPATMVRPNNLGQAGQARIEAPTSPLRLATARRAARQDACDARSAVISA